MMSSMLIEGRVFFIDVHFLVAVVIRQNSILKSKFYIAIQFIPTKQQVQSMSSESVLHYSQASHTLQSQLQQSRLPDKPRQWFPKAKNILQAGFQHYDQALKREIIGVFNLLDSLNKGFEEYRNGMLYLVILHPDPSNNIFELHKQEKERSDKMCEQLKKKELQMNEYQHKLTQLQKALQSAQKLKDQKDKEMQKMCETFNTIQTIKSYFLKAQKEISSPAEQINPDTTKTQLKNQPNCPDARDRFIQHLPVERQQNQPPEINAKICFQANAKSQARDRHNQSQMDEDVFGDKFSSIQGKRNILNQSQINSEPNYCFKSQADSNKRSSD